MKWRFQGRGFTAVYIGLSGFSLLAINEVIALPQAVVLGILLVTFVVILLVGVITGVMLWNDIKLLFSESSKVTAQSDKSYNEPQIAVRLLQSLLPSDESQQNIIGDLLEEFSQFESKNTAYIWLCKQVLKSVLPLVYKNLKSRLASYFGEWIR